MKSRGPSPLSLERSALFRLERAALSEKQLRDALQESVRRAHRLRGGRPLDDEVAGWIDAVIAKMIRLGLLDDVRTAEARARSLRAAGNSRRGALAKLRRKGFGQETATRALAAADGSNAHHSNDAHDTGDTAGANADGELEAAIAYARRRRLAEKDAQKALMALARRGFAFDVAKRALARVLTAAAIDA